MSASAASSGHGRVYNLHHLSDFSGTYGGLDRRGDARQRHRRPGLKNAQGVEIRIDDVTRGARLSGSADGIQLELQH